MQVIAILQIELDDSCLAADEVEEGGVPASVSDALEELLSNIGIVDECFHEEGLPGPSITVERVVNEKDYSMIPPEYRGGK